MLAYNLVPRVWEISRAPPLLTTFLKVTTSVSSSQSTQSFTIHPSCRTLKRPVASASRKSSPKMHAQNDCYLQEEHNTHLQHNCRQLVAQCILIHQKNIYIFCTYLIIHLKTTATILCCYLDLPSQYFNACYWHNNKFMADCISLSYLKPLTFVSCRKEICFQSYPRL